MAADPNGFDYFNAGEPFPAAKGASSAFGFDYFNAGEPLLAPVDVAAAGGTVYQTYYYRLLQQAGAL